MGLQRKVRSRSAAALMGILGLLSPATRGQDRGAPGNLQGQRSIRVQVRLVPVDVIATDSRGRPVTDLKREDFQIFENGHLQEISHFILQKLTATTPEPDALQKPVLNLEPAAQSSRTFLIMMGRGRFQTPFRSVDALTEFVRNGLLPQDRVAVYAYNRATDFTTDHEQVAQALERYSQLHERIEASLKSRLSDLAAFYADRERILASFQPQIDWIFKNPVGPGPRQLIPGLNRNAAAMTKDARTVMEQALIPGDNPSRNAFTAAEAELIADLEFDEYAASFGATLQDVQNIVTCIQYLRYREGEKHLLFFTPAGLMLPKQEYENSLAHAANDARVAIDIFQTGGLDPTSGWTRTFAIGIRNISDLTGGRASVYEDTAKALARLDRATRTQYLLGYYPKDENWNGKYRRINVKVSRPGVQVSFRHGYYASDTVVPINREDFFAYDRIAAAAAYAGELGDIAFEVRTSNGTDIFSPPEIRADLKIETLGLGLKKEGAARTGKLYTVIFYKPEKGGEVDYVWGGVDLNLTEEQYQEAVKNGILFTIPVPRKQPKQLLKVIIYDPGSDRVGSKLISLPG